MRVSSLEQKRLSRVSIEAYKTICELNNEADKLWNNGFNNDSLRSKANGLYAQADKIYKEQVLYRKVNNDKRGIKS